MFLSKRANVVYKVEHQPSSTESKSCIKENIVWTLVYCSSIGSSAVSVSLSHLYLVVASVGCLLLYRFPEDAPQEVESEESHTIDGFLTDETPVVCDESFDGDKYIPSGIGFEKQLFFSNRINIGCTEKGTWITALCPCVATDEEYMSLLVQSRWIIVGWNNGSIGLVDIYKGKVLGEFYSEQVQSAICCLAHQRKSSVFASGHVNGDIWLWSWQPCDSSLLSLNGPCEEVLCPFSVDEDMKELYKCTFRRIPLTRIDTGTMEPRNWIRFTTLPDDCILLSTTSNNQLQFFYIREPHYPFMNADERFHLSTTNIVIENCYGQILDSIVTNNCIISCGQDDTIRIFHHNYSFPNSSALLPSCELYQHFSYVTCLEMSRNQKVLISASLDGTVLFWLLEDCLPSRYVHPFCRIYLENMTIRRIQLVSHHLLVSGNTSQNSWVFYCLTLPAIVEKEIY